MHHPRRDLLRCILWLQPPLSLPRAEPHGSPVPGPSAVYMYVHMYTVCMCICRIQPISYVCIGPRTRRSAINSHLARTTHTAHGIHTPQRAHRPASSTSATPLKAAGQRLRSRGVGSYMYFWGNGGRCSGPSAPRGVPFVLLVQFLYNLIIL